MRFFVADALGVQVPALYLGGLGPVALLIACYVVDATWSAKISAADPLHAARSRNKKTLRASLRPVIGPLLLFAFMVIAIVLVTSPIVHPVLESLAFTGHVDPAYNVVPWIAVLVTLNLQTSFPTPPFGYALFLLKGSAPPEVRMMDIYRGVVPYVGIQLIVIAAVAVVPAIATWLPDRIFDLSLPHMKKFNE